MDKQLLRRLHDVRYREITGMIGRRIAISSLHAIAANVIAALGDTVSVCGKLELRSTNMRGTLAKYKMLDLSFATYQPVLSSKDGLDRTNLTDLGFLLPETDVPDQHAGDEDPTCLVDLLQNLDAGHERVKVFLDVWPFRDSAKEYMQAIQQANRDGLPDPSRAAFIRMMDEADRLFPGQFQIRDICITNADSIWLHKHFYM